MLSGLVSPVVDQSVVSGVIGDDVEAPAFGLLGGDSQLLLGGDGVLLLGGDG